jgi:hypothetical protein
MSHLVSRQPWGVIDLDTVGGRIVFQQDWFYTWTLFNSTVSAWNLQQKRLFHNTLDRQIWSCWSKHTRLRVTGSTPFARRFAASGVPITFDIRWVLRPGHYGVIVRKMPSGSTPDDFISSVDFGARRIELDCADLTPYRPENEAEENNPVTTSASQKDAATTASTVASVVRLGRAVALLVDTNRIENVGRQVRPRHLHDIIDALNALTPGVTWSMPVGVT